MLKKILIIITLSLFIIPSILAVPYQELNLKHFEENFSQRSVFIEYDSTTWCPQCPDASKALYDLFVSEQFPFYYISLVSDVNPNAKIRSKNYNTIAIPTVYIDGGKSLFVGNAGSYDSLKNIYKNLILEHSNQTTNHNISIQSKGEWLGNAQIRINVTITNNENKLYIGKLRTYVNEIITTRWLNSQGEPYHYAFLDFAINEQLVLSRKTSKTFTTIWDGKINHSGLTFDDIKEDNIMICSAIFHWIPHLRFGYVGFPYLQFFLSHYTDTVDVTYLI
jgi:glutaredoxin